MLRIVERVTIRTTTLIRAIILTSIVGHGVADALFDRNQYSAVDSKLLTRLDDPFLIQAALALIVVVMLAIRDRRRSERSCISARWLPLAALLVGLQLLLFVGLESSERFVLDFFAGEAAHAGIFGTGFIAELLVAVGSAIFLALVAEASRRWFKFRRPEKLPGGQEQGSPLSLGFAPTVGVLSGAGGVRAPPS